DGTNIVDENGLIPVNAELPDIYVSTGCSPASESVTLSDVTLPEITELQPEQGSLVNTNKPANSAVFVEEGSGINESCIVMTVAGENILSTNYTYDSDTKTVSYTPTEVLDEGMCTVTVDVNDNAGNPATQAYWTFTIDTVAPTIEDKLPTGEEVRVTSAVIITFNEPMNTAGLEDAFSIEPEVTGAWHWTWDPPGLIMRGTHDVPFTVDTTYICTIDAALAKDLTGNPMELDVVWNFTTASSPSVTLNSPYGLIPEDWTGGSTHEVNYTVAGGESPYTIYINYTTDNWVSSHPIGTATHYASGLYDYEWTLPLNNSEFVKVRIEVVDNVSAVHSDESNDFIVDSTAPEVNWTIPENGSEVVAQQYLVIQFTEPVDKTSVLAAFSITPDPGGWLWGWNTAGDKLTGMHNPFEIGRTYTCTISTDAKDD
ncbi:hypothetical protein FP804_00475, partial [archaeon]|nr:hypothetical protein [archaeon]